MLSVWLSVKTQGAGEAAREPELPVMGSCVGAAFHVAYVCSLIVCSYVRLYDDGVKLVNE